MAIVKVNSLAITKQSATECGEKKNIYKIKNTNNRLKYKISTNIYMNISKQFLNVKTKENKSNN